MGALIVFLVFGGPFVLWFSLALSDALGIGLLGGIIGVFLIPVIAILFLLLTNNIINGNVTIPKKMFIGGKKQSTENLKEKFEDNISNCVFYCNIGNYVFVASNLRKNEDNLFYIYDFNKTNSERYWNKNNTVLGTAIYSNGVVVKISKTKGMDVKLAPIIRTHRNILTFSILEGDIQRLYEIPFEEKEIENAIKIYYFIKNIRRAQLQ